MLGATSSAVCTPHPLIGTVEGSNLQQNRNRNIGAWPWPASSSCAKRASSASGDLGPSVQPARFSVHSHPVGECLYVFSTMFDASISVGAYMQGAVKMRLESAGKSSIATVQAGVSF